jgi:uncharacterized membrane protein YtjA (UPF0391 family)
LNHVRLRSPRSINTGRGALVDTPAVIASLKSGHVGYLGLDVHDHHAAFNRASADAFTRCQGARSCRSKCSAAHWPGTAPFLLEISLRNKRSATCGMREEDIMLYYALVFLVVALVAGVLGVSGVAAVASQIAWVLFVIAIVLFIVHFVSGRRTLVP